MKLPRDFAYLTKNDNYYKPAKFSFQKLILIAPFGLLFGALLAY